MLDKGELGDVRWAGDRVPSLSPDFQPPVVLGAAALATLMMHGASETSLASVIEQSSMCSVAKLFDLSILHQLGFNRDRALALQDVAIAAAPCVRVARADPGEPALRLLALVAPGDMMVNTPLDFITRHINVQLDLLFLVPGQKLPDVVPDHDLMFFAATEPDASTMQRMLQLFDSWPRPVMNDPVLLPSLARDRLPTLLTGHPGVCSPPTVEVGDDVLGQLARGVREIEEVLPGSAYPILVRPRGSHAGIGLRKIDNPADLVPYAIDHSGSAHFVTPFLDYRSPDGLYRKSRIALIDGEPYLCHRAVSSDWMVHYLNAGMEKSAVKRADEALAMAQFDKTFAERHRDALAEIYRQLPFNFFSIDCSELADGRLLVFEADTAAIIHLMEPADLYPYKHAQMRRVFDAFGAMLQRHSKRPRD